MSEVEVIGGIGEMKSNFGTQFFQQHRVYNSEGLSPALNASGEQLVPKIVHVQQASKEPVPCKIGGGGGLELSRQQDKTRSSNRERRDLPDSDNGEYP